MERSSIVPLFVGFDAREEVGYHVFCSSVLHRSTVPVSFTPLHNLGADYQRDGTNAFIYSRFLVPFLMDYSGWAIFADGCDMLVMADIAELWALRDFNKAVQVVQHDYLTKHPRKYLGTEMEADNLDYPRKNWSSLMLINCGHFAWRRIDPQSIGEMPGSVLHRFSFIPDKYIGELPIRWNWLCQEYGDVNAKLIHYTLGIPAFPAYKDCQMAEHWHEARRRA